MLLSLRKNGLTSLFKEVRVFKVASDFSLHSRASQGISAAMGIKCACFLITEKITHLGALTNFYTEQMDAEDLGRKLLLTPSDPRRAPEKQTVGTVTASHSKC